MPTIRIGSGAGFAGDRLDPAVKLAKDGNLDYLVFECLGERTVAAGQLRRLSNPATGYDPLLETRMRAVLPHTVAQGTTVVTNSGAAHPEAAARLIARVAAEVVPDRPVTVAYLTGDSVLSEIRSEDPDVWETGRPLSSDDAGLVSAHAYLGVEHVLPAFGAGADVIVTGRLADPSLFLAPMVHEFGWDLDDWGHLGAGTFIGHLLECAGQVTGGYFADPVTKPVPGMADLGFPFADINDDGTAVLGKLADTGGMLTRQTVREQMLYEVADPSAYLTPDVTADFSGVHLEEVGTDAVRVSGATGRPRTGTLKVTLGFRGGWLGEGQITYAGPRARQRAEMAWDIVRHRLEHVHGIDPTTVSVEFIGDGAAFRGMMPSTDRPDPPEVRLRVAARVDTDTQARAIGWEVEALYCAGPAAGGGARTASSEVLAIRSALLPRERIAARVTTVKGDR
ncbi:ABC transporter substrate-binding protein [Corynebacterium sp. CNJ-954]|uniref:acyclic terpene utilization AtuA family protein n=1 Tax=Corynebacterium sp. CNJ-954 TaxID=1904962 RepID=UPI000968A19E|nr:acyclic terpene utilization AtuA family protein [Corynebacterium sp. CNJ-954]OLT54750.1 ABC transporter substrate-binding protein [Corynebacterium sp. CNJ-954]